MSNPGQAILTIVGTAVGAYFGNPQLGFVLGELAGSALFPTQLPAGPRITDNRTTTASVGGPVPIVFGTADVSGTVLWLAPFIEHSETQGGKGGPEQKTFSYTQSIAIGLCERVDDNAAAGIGAIAGLSRIWENGTIVYDIRPQQEANTDLGTLAESDEDYANRLQASATYAETFTLYLGDENQTADPTIEAIEGMGNVPGFRGLAYIVYPDRQLQIAQGQRHPSFTFEVFQFGTGNCNVTPQTSNQVLYPWFDPRNVYQYTIQSLPSGSGAAPGPYNILDDAITAAFSSNGVLQNVRMGYNVPSRPDSAEAATLVPLSGSIDIGSSQLGVTVDPSYLDVNYNFIFPTDGLSEVPPSPPTSGFYTIPGSQWWAPSNAGSDGNAGIVFTTSVSASETSAYPPWDTPYRGGSRFTDFYWFESVQDLALREQRFPGPPADPCAELTPSPNNPGYGIDDEGRLVKCNVWVKDTSQTYRALQTFLANAGPDSDHENYTTRHPLNPCIPISDPNYDSEAFWVAAYNQAVSDGKIGAGKTYGVDYPMEQSFGYQIDMVICEGQGNGALVSDIIAAICSRAGVTDIDVSDLTTASIPGYSISSVCDATDVISPLRSVAFFDCVESGTVLKFPTRGKEIVATLTTDDFGCFDGGSTGGDGSSNSNIPPAITTVRADETTLPRSIRLHYKAVSRDYQDGEADSPFRLATRAVDDQDISIPLVLEDNQAVQASEIIWSDAWAAQNSHELSVDQAWSALEAGDCIGVPIDGVIQRLRIVSDSNAAGILRKLQCVRDDQGSYISFALAEAPKSQSQTLKLIAPSSAEFLDLPCLQDADSDPGFYIAAQRLNGAGNSWKGATIYKSVDGGATFTAQFSLLNEATMGDLISALPVSDPFTWDTSTVIDVHVASAAFTFESRTDDAVLAGANAAAIGADGRWEIVQYADATKISDTHWQLSRLLRGRRGTEHNIGRSRVGDVLVVISTGDLGRMPLQTTEIGAARTYKVVSIGTSFSSGINTQFVGHAEALECFSPVNGTAERSTDGDITISWFRRSRLGRTLMSGVDIPLGEATEAYSIDILDSESPDSPEVILRTLTSSNTSVLYTAAQQATDFGSPLPTSIKVAIYQLSAITGRGTPFIGTLEIDGISL